LRNDSPPEGGDGELVRGQVVAHIGNVGLADRVTASPIERTAIHAE
jgi:hypothetical protein